MTLKHIVNWREQYNNVRNDRGFQALTRLKNYFNEGPISYYDLFIYSLSTTSPKRFNRQRALYNAILGNNPNLKLPALYGYVRKSKPDVTLVNLIKEIKSKSATHSAYAYVAAAIAIFLCRRSYISIYTVLNVSTIADYDEQNGVLCNYHVPNWAKIILDRQKRLALSIGLEDTDPLFFIMRYNSFNKEYVYARQLKNSDDEFVYLSSVVKQRFGYDLRNCLNHILEYMGLDKDAYKYSSMHRKNHDVHLAIRFDKNSTYVNSNDIFTGNTVYVRAIEEYRYHLYAVYEYTGQVKKLWDYAYMLMESHNGLYLMHGTKGLYLAPFYMLGRAGINFDDKNYENRRDITMFRSLYKLGYESKEFYERIVKEKDGFFVHHEHTIKPRRLQTK